MAVVFALIAQSLSTVLLVANALDVAFQHNRSKTTTVLFEGGFLLQILGVAAGPLMLASVPLWLRIGPAYFLVLAVASMRLAGHLDSLVEEREEAIRVLSSKSSE